MAVKAKINTDGDKMTRAIIKLKCGDHINIIGNYIDLRDTWVMVWNGNDLVAIVLATEVISCHLSQAKE